MRVYLVVLSGQGDTEIKIVDEETWDWIMSSNLGQPVGEENSSSWSDTLVPQSQKDKAFRNLIDEDFPEDFCITIGSWQNDRAIRCYAADGYADSHYKLTDAIEEIHRHCDELVNEYHGVLY